MKPTQLYKSISRQLGKQQTRRQLQKLPDYLLDDLALSREQIEIEIQKSTLRYFCQTLLCTVFNLHKGRR